MSTPTERAVLNLLEAGWVCADVELQSVTSRPVAVFVIRTPPIPVSDSPDYARLIALAMGKENDHGRM